MSYMDQVTVKVQEVRQRIEQKGFELRSKMPFAKAKQMKIRSGPKITLATIKNRQLRTALKSKFPALKKMNAQGLPNLIGSRRGLRKGVPLFPLIGPRVGTTEGVPPVVEDREPRPSNGYNISVEM